MGDVAGMDSAVVCDAGGSSGMVAKSLAGACACGFRVQPLGLADSWCYSSTSTSNDLSREGLRLRGNDVPCAVAWVTVTVSISLVCVDILTRGIPVSRKAAKYF